MRVQTFFGISDVKIERNLRSAVSVSFRPFPTAKVRNLARNYEGCVYHRRPFARYGRFASLIFVKQKMNLIVLLRITCANCRKPLSHKAWRDETQPFDRSEDKIV